MAFEHDDASDEPDADAPDADAPDADAPLRSASSCQPTTTWEPRGYLLKRSPAKPLGLLGKKFAWQRRWFIATSETLCWYASSQAATVGHAPLGRVPRSMVLTARPHGDGSGFEVDLGNRVIHLQLDGVPKAQHEEYTRRWVEMLNHQEVLGDLQGEACSHKSKFWKVDPKSLLNRTESE